MEQRRLLGVFHLVYSALMVIPSVIVIITFFTLGYFSHDPEALTVFTIIGSVVSGILIILATPSLVVGIGLLYNRNWALILALVIGVLNLLSFPFGTALGIYSIYVYNLEHKPAQSK